MKHVVLHMFSRFIDGPGPMINYSQPNDLLFSSNALYGTSMRYTFRELPYSYDETLRTIEDNRKYGKVENLNETKTFKEDSLSDWRRNDD